MQPQAKAASKRSKQILWAVLGGLTAIIIAILAVIFLPKVFRQPRLTDLTTGADGDEISLATARAEEILADDIANLEQVEEFYDSEIDKETDFSQKTALLLDAMNFYVTHESYNALFRVAEKAEAENMNQDELSNYAMTLYNAYVSVGELVMADYWLDYYETRFPDSMSDGTDFGL